MTPAQLAAMAAAQMAAQRQQMVNSQVRRASAPRRARHARVCCTRALRMPRPRASPGGRPASTRPRAPSSTCPRVQRDRCHDLHRRRPAAVAGGTDVRCHSTQLMGMQGLFPMPAGLGMVPAVVTPVSRLLFVGVPTGHCYACRARC